MEVIELHKVLMWLIPWKICVFSLWVCVYLVKYTKGSDGFKIYKFPFAMCTTFVERTWNIHAWIDNNKRQKKKHDVYLFHLYKIFISNPLTKSFSGNFFYWCFDLNNQHHIYSKNKISQVEQHRNIYFIFWNRSLTGLTAVKIFK